MHRKVEKSLFKLQPIPIAIFLSPALLYQSSSLLSSVRLSGRTIPESLWNYEDTLPISASSAAVALSSLSEDDINSKSNLLVHVELKNQKMKASTKSTGA